MAAATIDAYLMYHPQPAPRVNHRMLIQRQCILQTPALYPKKCLHTLHFILITM